MRRAPVLETERLALRAWREADLAPFAAMNADPVVMEHFPAPLTRPESDAFVTRIRSHFALHGFGLWAVEIRDAASFGGFVGLSIPRFAADFMPCVEIGWRLARDVQGRGFATEAAREVLRFAFEEAGLDEIVSFTVPANRPSRHVMEKIGLTHDAEDDFEHPNVPKGSPLRPHVLYRIRRETWQDQRVAEPR